MTDDEIRHAANQILDRPFGDYDDDAAICARFALAALRPPVERADIPSYWSDRTAALAEALHDGTTDCIAEINLPECGPQHHRLAAKDALLYLREHGWTLEREER